MSESYKKFIDCPNRYMFFILFYFIYFILFFEIKYQRIISK